MTEPIVLQAYTYARVVHGLEFFVRPEELVRGDMVVVWDDFLRKRGPFVVAGHDARGRPLVRQT